MDYCGPLGLPHSEFLDWREDDQEKALWWSARNRQRCSGCGTHPDDWNDELGGNRHAYVAEEQTCLGCQRRSIAQDQLNQARQHGQPRHGAHVVLVPNPNL